ncbi:uncharacterized protein DEA37_0009419 [Paragonimus westermani]|uniref:Uncharacterized protein n=1 Tax=Paragonimus westermani TaxID=34504 RepID=A0A5J4NVY9_9TREM|nr:uncharacterized protein DEA37_0009419 [Paragonimus westermani]
MLKLPIITRDFRNGLSGRSECCGGFTYASQDLDELNEETFGSAEAGTIYAICLGVDVEETIQKLVAEDDAFEDPAILDISKKVSAQKLYGYTLEKILDAPAYPTAPVSIFGNARDIWSSGDLPNSSVQHGPSETTHRVFDSLSLLHILQQMGRSKVPTVSSRHSQINSTAATLENVRFLTEHSELPQHAVSSRSHGVYADPVFKPAQTQSFNDPSRKEVALISSVNAERLPSPVRGSPTTPEQSYDKVSQSNQLKGVSFQKSVVPPVRLNFHPSQFSHPRTFTPDVRCATLQRMVLTTGSQPNGSPTFPFHGGVNIFQDHRSLQHLPAPAAAGLRAQPPFQIPTRMQFLHQPPIPPMFFDQRLARPPTVLFASQPGSRAAATSFETIPRLPNVSTQFGVKDAKFGVDLQSDEQFDPTSGSWMTQYESVGVLLSQLRPLMVSNPYVQDSDGGCVVAEDVLDSQPSNQSISVIAVRRRRLLLARIERVCSFTVVARTRLLLYRQSLVERLTRELFQSTDCAFWFIQTQSPPSSLGLASSESSCCELLTIRKGVQLFSSVSKYIPLALLKICLRELVLKFDDVFAAGTSFTKEYHTQLYPSLRHAIYQMTDMEAFMLSCFPEATESLLSVDSVGPNVKAIITSQVSNLVLLCDMIYSAISLFIVFLHMEKAFGPFQLGLSLVFCLLDACARLSKPDDPSNFIRYGAFFGYLIGTQPEADQVQPLESFPHLASIIPVYINPDHHSPLSSTHLDKLCQLIHGAPSQQEVRPRDVSPNTSAPTISASLNGFSGDISPVALSKHNDDPHRSSLAPVLAS